MGKAEIKKVMKGPAGILLIAMLVAILILAAYLGAMNVKAKSSQESNPLEIVPTDEALPDPHIVLADSDYIDVDKDGKFDSAIDIRAPDKLTDIEERYLYGTNASDPDTDGDGMEDGWEALHSVENKQTGRLTIDPNRPDAFENPDGDGFDLNKDGIIEGDEDLTNIEEYCGGTIFEGMDPVNDRLEIAIKGGFHLAWKLKYNEEPETEDQIRDAWIYYNPYRDAPVTTDPSERDSDGDGIDDAYELHYEDVARLLRDTVDGYTYSISPLNESDAGLDMDVYTDHTDPFRITKYLKKDLLTNLEEYHAHTDPTNWDTDGDSMMFGTPTGEPYPLDDRTELNFPTIEAGDSNVDWDNDGQFNLNSNPNDPDTDGDFMPDAWEYLFNLNPCNSSDKYQDYDFDGLSNFDEFGYPSLDKAWFSTDPQDWDTDDDSLPDGWEAKNCLVYDSYMTDTDGDGYDDSWYFDLSLDPSKYDTDGDGVHDGMDDIDTVAFNRTEELGYLRWDFQPQPDNLTNYYEYAGIHGFDIGTDPNDPDTDGDTLSDGEELINGYYGELIEDNYYTNPAVAQKYYTNASAADTDMDSDPNNSTHMLDDWEETTGYFRDPNNRSRIKGPFTFGPADTPVGPTNATNPDTDLDGLKDWQELFGVDTNTIVTDPLDGYGRVTTNPCAKDSDLDDLTDAEELDRQGAFRPWITNPNAPDSDGDNLEDGLEEKTDFFPFDDHDNGDNFDANGDGQNSAKTLVNAGKRAGIVVDPETGDIYSTVDRTNPRKKDTDNDGLTDYYEYKYGFATIEDNLDALMQYDKVKGTQYVNALQSDKYVEGVWLVNPLVFDAFEDWDRDGLTNIEEFDNGTDPLKADTDDDGLPDLFEIKYQTFGSYQNRNNVTNWGFDLDPTKADSNENDVLDDEDGDGNKASNEEIIDGLDNDGDGLIDEEWDLNDGNEDLDDDGIFYRVWTQTSPGVWERVQYYHPFTNYEEYSLGRFWDDDVVRDNTTHPNYRDSDMDGMWDGWEIWASDAPPTDINETPGEGEDNDLLPAGWERMYNGTSPITKTDYQPYGLVNERERFSGQFNSNLADSDGDGTPDTHEDPDNDGFTNLQEYRNLTDPTWTDSSPLTVGLGSRDESSRSQEVEGEDEAAAEESMDLTFMVEMPEDPFTYLEELGYTASTREVNLAPSREQDD